MTASLVEALECILEEDRKLLATRDADVADYEQWGARRAKLFELLIGVQFERELIGDARVRELLLNIIGLADEICERLEREITSMGEQLSAARNLQDALSTTKYYPPLSVQRSA